MSSAGTGASSRRRLPRLHVVTDDAILASPNWLLAARDVVAAGGTQVALHLRGHRTATRDLLELADALRPFTVEAGSTLLVNDRVDIALAASLDGVHLGTRSLPVSAARGLVGPNRWLGASCHHQREVEEAAEQGADFAFVGTIHRTASHPGREGIGPEGVAELCGVAGTFPLIGIGGVGPEEAPAIIEAGAHGVAAVRGVWSAPDPAAALRRYFEALAP